MRIIAVLFCCRDSIYKSLPGTVCYDVDRDALSFAGGCAVVAHPPCRTWGCLKAFATAAPRNEHALGPWAIGMVRRSGGVVEHPKGSTLFRECECALPGGFPDEYGGITVEVDQFHWGHKARKRTLLYIVGCPKDNLPPMPHREGNPTHVIDRPGSARKAERPNSAGKLPWVSHREREATPEAFANWLLEVARRTRVADAPLFGEAEND